MRRPIAMAMVLVAGGCGTTDPPAPSPTTTPPAPTSVAPPATSTTSVAPAPPPPPTPSHPGTAEEAGAPTEGNEGAASQTAKASWYARGSTTANGERFDPDALTAAHRTLAFGTRLRVCHVDRCVEVRVNDRGPALWTGRELDLSRAAFAAIAPLGAGVVDVTWEAA